MNIIKNILSVAIIIVGVIITLIYPVLSNEGLYGLILIVWGDLSLWIIDSKDKSI